MTDAITTLTAANGETIKFRDRIIASGGMKDVYASPERDYVVAFYRKAPDVHAIERLDMITGPYRERIFEGEAGDYWKQLFCWPTTTVQHGGRIGVVAPFYHDHFFFKHGSFNNDMLKIRGKDKQGKWFASPHHQFKFLDARERGNWLGYLQLCLKLARALRRLHAAGLAHSDLSYKNVLLAPTSGRVCIIDVDGLVVPARFPPEVVGTPDLPSKYFLSNSIPAVSGQITEITGINAVRKWDGIVDVMLFRTVGDSVASTVNSTDVVGYVLAATESREASEDLINQSLEAISITVK